MSASVYEIVTKKIIDQLNAGVVPWRKPWKTGIAVNWRTQRPYRGINALLLEPGEYATFQQISEAGGKVKKGEIGNIVVLWKWLEKEDEETGEIVEIPYLRYYKVFEINRQCEGLKSKRKDEFYMHDPVEEAEKIISGYTDAPVIRFRSGEACYLPSSDQIIVPPLSDYKKPEEYYSTIFHEMIHSTGHSKRIKRKGITDKTKFGDETYSKEELIAEIGAAMLCGVARIDNATIENSAAYIAGWLRVLQNDNRIVVRAAAQAQKAADYILGRRFEEE